MRAAVKSALFLFLLLPCSQANAETLYMGQHSDMSTNNPWTSWGPRSEVWNTYPASGLYPSVHTTAAPSWQFVPYLAMEEFDPADIKEAAIEDVFPEGVPPERKEHFKSEGELIETLEYIDFTLYDFAEWSDGEPVTAFDVEFTHNITLRLNPVALGGNHPSFTPPDLLAKTKALDRSTIRYYFMKEDARIMFGALTRPVLPRHYWEPLIEEFMQTEDPLGALFGYEDTSNEPSAGPFLRGRWERGAFVYRKANTNYSWKNSRSIQYSDGTYRFVFPEHGIDRKFHGDGEGEVVLETGGGPFVEEIIYSIYSDQAAAVMALARGDIDFSLNSLGIEAGFQRQLEGFPGIELVSNPSYGFRYMAFNLRKEPFSDISFRRAVAVLIDREFLAERVLQGAAIPLHTVIPAGNVFWHNTDVPVYGRGLSRSERAEEAVNILKDAGYSWDKEPSVDHSADRVASPGRGLKMPGGGYVPQFEMLAPGFGYDPLRAVFAIRIEQWCNEIGIPLKARLTDFSLISERVFRRQDFDAWMFGWGLGNPAFPTFLDAFFHSRHSRPGGFNAQGYDSPEYDRLAEEFLSTLDLDRARIIAFRLQEIIAEDLPYIVLFDSPVVEAYRKDRLKYPYTEVLGGIQFLGGMISDVKVIE